VCGGKRRQFFCEGGVCLSRHGIFIEPGSVDVRLAVFLSRCVRYVQRMRGAERSGAGSLLKIREEKSGAAGNALRGRRTGITERRAQSGRCNGWECDESCCSTARMDRGEAGEDGGEAVCRITVEATGVVGCVRVMPDGMDENVTWMTTFILVTDAKVVISVTSPAPGKCTPYVANAM
jgi:hypothetical protein